MFIVASVYWALLALGLFLSCLSAVVGGEGSRVLKILATVVFGVLLILALVGVAA